MKKEKSMPNFIENEQQMLKFWQEKNCYEKYMNKNKGSKKYYAFLDGPVTANNAIGVHHAWNRSLKDAFLKYKVMNGFDSHFQAGFDSQGLWVEVETEKDLNLKDKRDIESLGLDKFTKACMDRVNKYAKIIEDESVRLGQWMDWKDSYFTNSDENITSIWHFLKICFEKGWLVQKYRPMPWCSHCGTSLSEHELADSYKDMEHLAVFFKLPIKNSNNSVVVWTTTPWTLSANVAVAVNPELEYAICKVKSTDRKLIVCTTATKILKDDLVEIEKTVKGSELVGLEYETCFEELPLQNFAHKIVAWEDVDSTEGSGLVHIAPGCGAEDFELGQRLDLPNVIPVDEEGNYYNNFGFLSGLAVDSVADLVFDELKKRNKLYYTHKYMHRYPVCWRCKKPLIFRLTKEWYIKVDEIRPLLIKAIDDVEWQPEFIKKRMLDWLQNMGDWCISRKRFYGLPLPFYICEKCGKVHVIGSMEELEKRATDKEKLKNVPHLHRPYIDEVEIKCDCGGTAKRVSDVGDCWLDAGITPFSTQKYFTDKEFFEKNFPAEVVIEMKEQIRLWFYSLLFMSVTLTGKAPYKKVIGFGMLVAEDGSKFSKSGKNNIRLDEACDKFGADTIRYMFASNNMLSDTRFGENICEDIKRKLLALWNSYIFFNTYAVLDNPKLEGFVPSEDKLDITDKWLAEITNQLIANSRKYYEANTLHLLIKDVEKYIDDLSNWYIRVNRKRFWKSDDEEDKKVAYFILYSAIKTVCQIMCPITPFMTEYIWQNMVREIETKEAESILLSAYPTKIMDISKPELAQQTEDVRNIITLALKLRNENNLKIKQPLRKMFICASHEINDAVELYSSIIKDELNIKDIVFEKDAGMFNDHFLTINFKKAGAVLKGDVQKLKVALENLTAEQTKVAVEEFKLGIVNVGEFKNLSNELFLIQNKAKPEYVISTVNNTTVVLDVTLDKELEMEGLYREITRNAQIIRKEAGFDVENRIYAKFETSSKLLSEVIGKYNKKIKEEVLILELNDEMTYDFSKEIDFDGEKLKISVKKA